MRGVKLGRGLSIVLLPEGGDPRTINLSRRVLRFLVWSMVVATLVFAALAASWSFLFVRAYPPDDPAVPSDSRLADQARVDSLHQKIATLEERWAKAHYLLVGRPDTLGTGLWLAREGGNGNQGRPAAVPLDPEAWAWPLTVSGYMTQGLVAGADRNHPGIDIAVQTGSYILAAADGRVKEAAEDPDYGLFVQIDHGDGLHSLYGHASELHVARGSVVRRGEVVAMSGSTGNSTAPHLHFEITRNGNPIDPRAMVVPPS